MSLPAGPGGGGGAVLPGLYTYEVPCSQQQRHTEWPRRFSRVMGNVCLKPSLGQHLFRRPTCQALLGSCRLRGGCLGGGKTRRDGTAGA